MRRVTKSRKLLVASAGVATVAYLSGCEDRDYTTGNLMPAPEAPPEPETSTSAERNPERVSTAATVEAVASTPPEADKGIGGAVVE